MAIENLLNTLLSAFSRTIFSILAVLTGTRRVLCDNLRRTKCANGLRLFSQLARNSPCALQTIVSCALYEIPPDRPSYVIVMSNSTQITVLCSKLCKIRGLSLSLGRLSRALSLGYSPGPEHICDCPALTNWRSLTQSLTICF